jgi:DNA-binding response OmpR family regulator
MPGEDGIALCRRLRSRTSVPILLVSALGDIQSRVRGLQAGADDYLPKPFDVTELLARVDALLRRSRLQPRTSTAGILKVGDLTIDLTSHVVAIRAPRSIPRRVELTATEFKLLLVLARAPGRTFTRHELETALWGAPGADPAVGPNTLSASISDLRERLEVEPRHPRYLQTVRGVGYRLDP